jgi:hypothetical protein
MHTPFPVAPSGAWSIADPNTAEHKFDTALCAALQTMVVAHQIASLVDLGCGLGHYQSALAQVAPICHGFDGNPHTSWLTQGRCGMIDLSVPVNLGRRYDLVLSLEVGEHIPLQFEATYLDNLDRHAQSWLVLSWAVPGQGGLGHVNERSNAHIQEQMATRGWHLSAMETATLRAASQLPWFKDTVMAFHRMDHQDR